MMHTRLLRRAARLLMPLALAGAAAHALAAAYVFPTSMPAGCSGSGGSYTCSALTLGNSDTVAIAAPLPATITINGNFTVNKAVINAAGQASDLTLTVTGALSIGNQGQINGNVSAASITNSGGRGIFGGSVTSSGAVSLGNSATVAGSLTATSGTIALANSSAVSQCVQSTSSAAITLSNGASAGAVCCGALGSCSSACVVNNSGSAMPALCSGPPGPGTVGSFNAFDTGTAAGSTSGVIHTKVAGTAFNVAIAALNTTGSALATAFSGSVKVELLDSSNNTGALSASTGCRSSWTAAAGTSSSTLTFATSDQGRKNIALTVADAWRDARIRISYPATGTATAVGCSSDNFAVRPASFASFSVTDATLQTAGTTRTLASNATSGGNVHKAGQPFTVRATAVNGATTPVATGNYTGTPTAAVTACSGGACSATLGTLSITPTATAGVINTATASYSEAGAFSLQLVDSAFSAVDAADGSTAAERNFSSAVLTVGRFIPDHFDIALLVAPVLLTFNSSSCSMRSFTYMGQPFGYATPPQAMVLARNAAGATTANYPNAKLSALVRTQTYTPLSTATPGVDSTGASLPGITPNGNGTAVLATQAADLLKVVRPTTTPLAPFNAAISLAWSVADTSETGTGNGSITTTTPLTMANIAFDQGSEFRFGMLKFNSAYGSEFINLALPMELQYWNGTTFATNAADPCTTLATSTLALGPYRGNLAACETAPASAALAFASGRALLTMRAPGGGNAGSADLTVNLGTTATGQQCSSVGASATPATPASQDWLQGKAAGGTTYNQNPAARISFGQYRSPLIHLKEMY